MVSHLDHLRGRHDVESVSRAVAGCEHLPNTLLIAEEHNPAPGVDRFECHYSTLDSCFGREIAAHGIYTNL